MSEVTVTLKIKLRKRDLDVLQFIAKTEAGLRKLEGISIYDDVIEKFGETGVMSLNSLEYWHLVSYSEGSKFNYKVTDLGREVLQQCM